MARRSAGAAVAVLVLAGWLQGEGNPPSSDEDGVRVAPLAEATAPHRAQRAVESSVRQALKKRIAGEVNKVPLKEAQEFLQRQSGAKAIRIDSVALMEDGINADELVSLPPIEVTLGEALHHILQPLGLTWIAESECLKVTTTVKAEDILIARVFQTGRLQKAIDADQRTESNESPARVAAPPRELIAVIEQLSRGPWQSLDGTGGTMVRSSGVLTIRTTHASLEDAAGLLKALDLFVEGRINHGMAEVIPEWVPSAHVAGIRQGLSRKIPKLELKDVPLHEVVAQLNKLAGLRAVLDEVALQEDGINRDEPVTFSAEDVTARSALDLILNPLGLTADIEQGFLRVTTSVKAEDRQRTVVYDVRDLHAARMSNRKLIELIQSETSGPWLDVDGNGGRVLAPLRGCLAVKQSSKVHQEIAVLLEDLREQMGVDANGKAVVAGMTPEELGRVDVRFYPIVRKGVAAQMEKAVTEFIAPDSWQAGGGDGAIRVVGETLVVRNTARVHLQIEDFLRDLKSAEDAPPK